MRNSLPKMLTPENILLVIGAFLTGGFIKGAIGMGLPVIVLATLVLVMPLRDAMAVFLMPAVAANIVQALSGPHLPVLLRRMWSFLGAASIGIFLGVTILAGTRSEIMVAVIGVLLCLYSTYSLIAPRLPEPGRREGWMSPVFGGAGGVIFGMAGIFIVPGLLYLETLGMKRDQFVQALGLTFVTITASLAVFMTGHSLVTGELAVLSAIGITPVFTGIWAGRRLRHRISEERYRGYFFIALFVTGIYMMARTIMSGQVI